MPDVGASEIGVIVAIVAAASVFLVRASFLPETPLRWVITLLLVFGVAVESVGEFLLNGGDWRPAAPLALCDISVGVAIAALLTRNRLMAELTYLWGASGAFLAIVTPDLPDHRDLLVVIAYFVKHGALTVAAVGVAFRFGLPPRPGAVWRALVAVNVVALVMAGVNWMADTNYMFLREKPDSATPLDYFGPWPYYILVAEALSVVLYALLYVPFWFKRRQQVLRPRS